MTTITRTTPAVALAMLDITVEGPDEPTYGVRSMRAPDMIEHERLYWIGPDCTVSCWMSADLVGLTDALERAGWMARTGAKPSQSGLIVEPHNPDVPCGPLRRNGVLHALWGMARETLLTRED